MWFGRRARTGEECAHWDVDRDDVPFFVPKRGLVTCAGETVECVSAYLLGGSETLVEDMTSTGGHARSSSEVSKQSLEEMFLKYVPPPRGYDSV